MVYKKGDCLALDFHLVVNAFDGDEHLAQCFGRNDVVQKLYRKSAAEGN